uniref:Uncharacterized protein n=1 Tax=Tetranychus urticae TaxID=32264 RepID=T1JZG8_TETUR
MVKRCRVEPSPVASTSKQRDQRSPLSAIHSHRITRRSATKQKRLLDFANIPIDFNEFAALLTETVGESDPKQFFMKCFHMFLISRNNNKKDESIPGPGDQREKNHEPQSTNQLVNQLESQDENQHKNEIKHETTEVLHNSEDSENELLEMVVNGPEGELKVYFYYLVDGKKLDDTEYESFLFKLNVEKIKLGVNFYECGCQECLASKNPRTGDFKTITRHQLLTYNAKFSCSLCEYLTQEKCNFMKHLERQHTMKVVHRKK